MTVTLREVLYRNDTHPSLEPVYRLPQPANGLVCRLSGICQCTKVEWWSHTSSGSSQRRDRRLGIGSLRHSIEERRWWDTMIIELISTVRCNIGDESTSIPFTQFWRMWWYNLAEETPRGYFVQLMVPPIDIQVYRYPHMVLSLSPCIIQRCGLLWSLKFRVSY